MTDNRPDFPTGTILGYPRIGRRRELKRAVEAHWAGALAESELEATAADLRRVTRERLVGLGLGRDDSVDPRVLLVLRPGSGCCARGRRPARALRAPA